MRTLGFALLVAACGGGPAPAADSAPLDSDDPDTADGPPDAALVPYRFIVASTDLSIAVYGIDDDGAAAPLRTIAGDATSFNNLWGLAFAPAAQEIIAADFDVPAIWIYPFTAEGNLAPTRAIRGQATGMGLVAGPVYDPVHDEVVACDLLGRISVFPRTADGDVTPLRRIAGASTGLSRCEGVDLHGDDLIAYEGGSGNVRVFPRTATGDASATRVIDGLATLFDSPQRGAIDPVHGELVVCDTGQLLTFPLAGSGDVAPLRVLALGDACFDVAYDEVRDELVVPLTDRIVTFDRTATGAASPKRAITGTSTFRTTSVVLVR